uniref:Uncharacterized protein n=1 Tax=Oryza brachyantha TaxID=4533 RepID=J3LG40_ORYBR
MTLFFISKIWIFLNLITHGVIFYYFSLFCTRVIVLTCEPFTTMELILHLNGNEENEHIYIIT